MKRVVQVKLLPTAEQDQALADTLLVCNEVANQVGRAAITHGVQRNYGLRLYTYAEAKAAGLAAQAAQHVIKKVADAYTTRRANARNGRYGPKGSQRRTRIESSPVSFRADAAQPFDDRCLSWQHEERTVSIWTTRGRMKNIAFTGQDEQLAVLATHRKGESDLIRRGDAWFLIATIDEPAPPVSEPVGFLGVDLGIVNIATTSDGANWSGGAVTARRKKNIALRAKLQMKGTKSAKRLLKKRSRKEARFVADVNHQISKSIVATAARTGRGISHEDLTGIRERVRLRRPQRSALHSWAFAQLGAFITYKAERAGVGCVAVDPRNSSRECCECGHIDKKNRTNQATFACRACGVKRNADLNAAKVLAARGQKLWGAVNLPHAA